MNRAQLEILARVIPEAIQAGQAAADAVEDGGTCNMDRVTLHLPGTRMSSLEAAGVRAFRLGHTIALRCSFGQANKNTAGVRAVSQFLKDKGYDAGVWYQMD